jgi:hypothetical protein
LQPPWRRGHPVGDGLRDWANLKFDTTYQPVLFDNSSVYFGKLQGDGTDYPVPTDVYYVQSQVNQETKKVKPS